MPRFSASAAGNQSSLPILDIVEEVNRAGGYSPNGAVPTLGMVIPRLARMIWPGKDSASVDQGTTFFDTSTGAPTMRYLPSMGITVHRLPRTVAVNGRGTTHYSFPITYRPYKTPTIPAAKRNGRRWVWEFVAWRDALVAGNIYSLGIQATTSGGRIPPQEAFNGDVCFLFRNLQGVNGDNWTVAYRTAFAASALTLINTSFSATVPRLFKMEFLEDWNGGGASLIMSIDGVAVATFADAQLNPAPLVDGNSPFWNLTFGNDSAAAGTFDYQCYNRLRVYSAGGED